MSESQKVERLIALFLGQWVGGDTLEGSKEELVEEMTSLLQEDPYSGWRKGDEEVVEMVCGSKAIEEYVVNEH